MCPQTRRDSRLAFRIPDWIASAPAEAAEEYRAFRRATDFERERILGRECEHLNTEDGKCLDCGQWIFPYDDPR
jgi:hypothetical protein